MSGDPWGSTLCTLYFDPVVQRRRYLRDMQETMVRLHPGSIADLTDGPRGQHGGDRR